MRRQPPLFPLALMPLLATAAPVGAPKAQPSFLFILGCAVAATAAAAAAAAAAAPLPPLLLLLDASWRLRTTPHCHHRRSDDIGWADFSYNNGTSHTPNVDAWAARDGTLIMQDMHSGGTVCSPTRATIL
jgi:hypothetical protein